MSQTTEAIPERFVLALAAGAASLVGLCALFVATMLRHYQAIDFPYFSFALLRIMAISGVVAAITFVAARHLPSLPAAALFGLVAGIMGGVAFVAAAA